MEQRYIWHPRPINIWVAINPCNRLQAHVLDQLRGRLEAHGCRFVQIPQEETPLGDRVRLAIGFGLRLREEVRPTTVYGRLPKPRGMVLMITTVPNLPDENLFHLARGQLLRKAGHIGIVIEGDADGTQVRRTLWGSMAGNYRLLEGDESEIFDNLALRILAHAGAEKVTFHEGDDAAFISWEEWATSPVHRDIAEAARALGAAGLIEDVVPLEKYGSGEQVREVLGFLNRAALGEGMRSQLDPDLRMMGVTTTGGGKVNVSPDPADGHIVPIAQLTWRGYLRALPRGCPVSYRAPSVEAHENGMVYLAGALLNAGVVDGFDSFLAFLRDHFSRHERIDILPEGMEPKVLAIEHFHRQPKEGGIRKSAQVEIVYPDRERFPEVDFPCGVREAELHLLSALFRSKAFRTRGRLDKVLVAILPGHGCVALYGGPRRELTDFLVNYIEWEEVRRV
ncbi:MAG TPA: hypothetical protein EYP52_08480 [Anaerolineae bacterium]|nr:hypothetical protein [Anaerolineae bacterium]